MPISEVAHSLVLQYPQSDRSLCYIPKIISFHVLVDNNTYRRREIILTTSKRYVATLFRKRKVFIHLIRHAPDYSPFCTDGHERWRGDTPPHFDRLRWGERGGAVEAKCGGCERGLLFRWRWHGGGEGTAGISSQESHKARYLFRTHDRRRGKARPSEEKRIE